MTDTDSDTPHDATGAPDVIRGVRALSDPTRWAVLELLSRGERPVSASVSSAGVGWSTWVRDRLAGLVADP